MVELAAADAISRIELAQATRNRGMPLEGLRYDVTPVGLHYLLIHFDIPMLDAASWRLRIGGSVRQELELTLDQVRALPATTIPVTLECAGNGRARFDPRPMTQPWLDEAVSTAAWTGTPLAGVLERAGVKADAVDVVFVGADHGIEGGDELDYARSLPVSEAMRPEILLAYEMNGRALEPQHGFPLRLLVPGWYGMASVKWLARVDVVTAPFEGFHQAVGYQYQRSHDDPGEPVSRIRPRALMIPPGFPDFPERRRYADRGPLLLNGRAWSGAGRIVRVQVRIDDEWFDATLDEPVGAHAWRRWSYPWDATTGEHRLSCRATDETGDVQPLDPPWNVRGLANNLVQEVSLTVR